MTERQTLFERFAQLPAPLRMAGYGAIALILFLVWSDHIAPTTREWTRRADAIQADVRAVRDGARIRREIRMLEDAILALGPVDVPRDAAEGSSAVHAVVNEILSSHGAAASDNLVLTYRGNVQGREIQTITPGRVTPQLLSVELRFDAAPEVAAAIISDIESRAEIEAITLMQMTRMSGRRVNVRLNIEAWMVPSSGGGAA